MKISRLFFLISVIFTAGCANQIGPGGGEPDKIPPEIISVFPESGTTNFKEDYIEFTFSEYVDKRSVQDAFFISPTLEGTPEFDWSGKSVRIEFAEELLPEITYVVTLGTEIVDLNNRNRMAAPFQFAFSTGNKIDKGIAEGRIYDDKPLGIMLFAFPVGDSLINPTISKPKYISQAGEDGRFRIMGMADNIYRIFAIGDEYQDLIYNIGQDSYGSPYTEFQLNAEDTLFADLNYFLSKEDTTGPRLISATMTDRFHILMEFSEEYDSSIINLNNYFLFDSTSGQKISPRYIFQGKTKNTELVLVTTDSLPKENNIFLFAEKVIDKNGNKRNSDKVSLTISDKPDTSAPSVFSVKNSGNQRYFFQLTDAFDSVTAKKGIRIIDRSNNIIPSGITFQDDASFFVRPLQAIKQREVYNVVVDLTNIIDAAGNSLDSLYKHRFSADTQLDFTGVSGKVIADEKENNIKVVLKPAEKGKKEYQRNTTKNLSFSFDKVDPGKYLLWSYIDRDSSDTYTNGLPFPFKESEKFTFYPDTLNLRARWPVGDILLEYKVP